MQTDVLILMGSDSDAPVMQASVDVLRELGIACEMTVASAHRSPERVQRLIREAPSRGVKLFCRLYLQCLLITRITLAAQQQSHEHTFKDEHEQKG